MAHRVEHEVVADRCIAFAATCVYPDMTHVRSVTLLELRDGLIDRQTIVQTWYW
jgi:hypothetical protein